MHRGAFIGDVSGFTNTTITAITIAAVCSIV